MKYEDFIKGIRAKYPEYNDVDDDALADSVLQKYPVYKEQIDPVVPYNPDKADRDILYKNKVNPVITQPGQGTILFGDKTLLAKPGAFDRINIRRLFIVLEKAISTAAKYTLF